MLETILVAFVTAAVTALGTFLLQERRLRALLESPENGKRSLDAIRSRLAAFDDAELRRILVRAGAVRFEGEGGKELWGLVRRNREDLK